MIREDDHKWCAYTILSVSLEEENYENLRKANGRSDEIQIGYVRNQRETCIAG
jgi:hypothetical protein